MLRRRLVLAVFLVVGILAVPAAILASTGNGSFNVEAAGFLYQTGPATTSGTAWSDVPGFNSMYVCTVSNPAGALVTASMNLSGSPVDVRVVYVNQSAQTVALPPFAAHFVPSKGSKAFSFTWVTGEISANHVALQWKSPTGATITATNSDLSAVYSGSNASFGCG